MHRLTHTGRDAAKIKASLLTSSSSASKGAKLAIEQYRTAEQYRTNAAADIQEKIASMMSTVTVVSLSRTPLLLTQFRMSYLSRQGVYTKHLKTNAAASIKNKCVFNA